MTRTPLLGFWYGEACLRPTGRQGYWASPINGTGVLTEERMLPTEALLFTRGHPSGKFAGQAKSGIGNLEYQESGGNGVRVGDGYGSNTVLYLHDGTLIQGAPQYGVSGLRYQADDGHVVTGDQTHLSPDGLLADYTELQNIRIGQNQQGLGALVQLLDHPGGTGQRYLLEPGDCQFIRFNWYPPNQLAVYVVKLQEQQAVAFWLTSDEIVALPVYPEPPHPVQPTFHFTHPVIVAPLKDPQGTSGADWEIVVNQNPQAVDRPCLVAADSLHVPLVGPLEGVYSEQADDPSHDLSTAAFLNTRLVLVRDGPFSQHPDPPTWLLRPWDSLGLEFYLLTSETVAQSAARWQSEVQHVLHIWPHDVTVVPMFYCQGVPTNEVFTVTQVLEGLTHLSALVNLSPRIKIVAPFEYDRANGITAHPELMTAWENLRTAGHAAGLATLTPIPKPPIPPKPPEGDLMQIFVTVDPTKVIAAKSVVSAAGFPGCNNYILEDGSIFSAHGDTRPPGNAGPWEAGQPTGAGIVTFWADGIAHSYGIVLTDKLPK